MTSDTEDLTLASADEALERSYEEYPYESHPYATSHPLRLATVARLFAMATAPVEACRVLEIGCASGGNLLPIACQYPDSEFVGVDLSRGQIESGNGLIDALGLTNARLEQRNVTELPADLGLFDYVICHGVYSWVPAEVRASILEKCRRHLAPRGVAYVSYNTYPGWHMRDSIRHMMLYHVQGLDDPQLRVDQARALLAFLAESVEGDSNHYGLYLKQELELLSGLGDSYLAHDHLEAFNAPVYFHEFADAAAAHELQYLGESRFSSMLLANFKAPVAEALQKASPDLVRMEQYMDFVRNRSFRETLLCHRDVVLNREIPSSVVSGLWVASPFSPKDAAQPDLSEGEKVAFTDAAGREFNVSGAVTKAALAELAKRWPAAASFESLAAEAGGAREALERDVLRLYASGLVELDVAPRPLVVEAGERPRASAFARLQARTGRRLTNLKHERINVDEALRHVVLRLDGEHDREATSDAIEGLVVDGTLTVNYNGKAVEDPRMRRELVSTLYDQIVPKLARGALLEA